MEHVRPLSQDLERGGSFLVSADRRIGVCDPNFPAGGLGRAASFPKANAF